MKKKITVLTLCAMLLALNSSAHAQQPKKVPRIGYLSIPIRLVSPSVSRQLDWLCASLATLKEITSPSSTDMRRGSSIDFPSLRPSWCVSRLISSWEQEGTG